LAHYIHMSFRKTKGWRKMKWPMFSAAESSFAIRVTDRREMRYGREISPGDLWFG